MATVTYRHSAFYREFTEVYSRLMEKDADMALEKELEILCEKYTEVFRANLTDRFPGIEFCDSIEESSDTWSHPRSESAPESVQYAFDGRCVKRDDRFSE